VDVPPEYLRRFFTKQGNTYQITKAVRDILVFSEQNVIKDPPFSRLNLISCRNLLIYMEGELQKRLLPLFHYALRKDGFLFLGSSETIGDATDLFEVVDRKWKIFQCKGGVLPHDARINLGKAPFPLELDYEDRGQEIAPTRMPSPRELTEQLLLEDYAPACVLVSEKGEGLYFHGATGKYLQPPAGEASWNIVGMARQGLQLDLSTALRKAITQKKSIRFERVSIKTNGGKQLVNLTVKPIPERPRQGAALLVIFEDAPPQEVTESADIIEPSVAADHRVMSLERELRSTREYLQTTIEELETSNEELKSTNEELQSANEELQSTNEELETSKEELQSVNEELVTVNSEHEVKLEELSNANNDMANLLASTDVGTIFLDNKICVQRFTPAVTKVVNLIQSDNGRPLSDIATNLVKGELVGNAGNVLKTLEPFEEEHEARDGNWYSVRMRPYRTTENIIEGAVITFIDITLRKQAEQALQKAHDELEIRVKEQTMELSEANEALRAEIIERRKAEFKQRRLATVVMDSNDAITLQDVDGNIMAWNQGAERMYGYTETEALKMNISDIVPKGKRREALDFIRRLSRGEEINSFEIQRLTKDGRSLDVWLTVTVLKDENNQIINIATTERDLTKLAELRRSRHGKK
jgi:two-component system CheB/CheR fusion protein